MKKLLFILMLAATVAVYGAEPRLPKASKLAGRAAGRKELPAPQMKIGTTTVVLHPVGKLNKQPILFYINPFTGEPKQLEPVVGEEGLLTWTFEQYATQGLRIDMAGGSLVPVVNPGEKIEAWVDYDAMRKHVAGEKERYVYYANGDFMHENNEVATVRWMGVFNKRNYSHFTLGARMPIASIDNFVDDIIARVELMNDSARMMSISGASKEILFMNNAANGMRAVTNMKTPLQVLGFGRGIEMEKNTDKIGAVAKLDVPKLLYGNDFGYSVPAVARAMAVAGAAPETGWLSQGRAFEALRKAETNEPLTAEDRAAATGYYGELLVHIEKKVAAEINKAAEATSYVIRETPQYGDISGVLDAIVAQYPGKVVFVDFWATWCGPCLQAMRTMRPLKPWMKENDIVSVYIGEVSSPYTRWQLMLPDIGGEHYYLTKEEFSALKNKYGIDSIPFYMVFGKDGASVYKHAGYPGNDAMKAEFEKAR